MAWEWLAPVSTGVVGIAGIVGASLGAVISSRAQRSIAQVQSAAETHRLMHADKRATFAKMLYQLESLADAAYTSWAAEGAVKAFEAEFSADTQHTKEYWHEHTELTRRCTDRLRNQAELRVEANKLQAEVAVLAGPEIHELVEVTFTSCHTVWQTGKRHDFEDSRDQLALAMHRHLMDTA